MGVKSSLCWSEEAHDNIYELRRVTVRKHDLGFICEEIFLDSEFLKIIAFHTRLKGHHFIHGKSQAENLILID